jgi:ATP:ADP antiporter, AAA family
LRNSLHRSATELLYFPLSHDVRKRYKALVDAIGQRGGQTLGSLSLLGAAWIGVGPRELAIAIAVLALCSILLSFSMREGYVGLFREHLRSGVEMRPAVPELDLHSAEHLITSLNSDRDDEVLASLKLLGEYGRIQLVPTLLLYHPSARIVVRTLELFAESDRKDFAPIARRLLDHDDPLVQDAAMRALAGALTPAEVLEELAKHRTNTTSTALLVTIVRQNLDTDGSAQKEIEEIVANGNSAQRIALVRAVRTQRAAALADRMHELVASAEQDMDLRRELAGAFEALRDPRAIPTLIRWLGPRHARAESRSALVSIGEPALSALSHALNDASISRSLRAHIPRTIAHFRSSLAGRILLAGLERERGGWVHYKILRALRSLHAAMPELRLAEEPLRRAIRECLVRAVEALGHRIALSDAHSRDPALRTRGGELLELVLIEKEEEGIDRAVRLLALQEVGPELGSIARALRSSEARIRAEGRELVFALAHPASIAAALSELLDEAPARERHERASAALSLKHVNGIRYGNIVRDLMSDPSEAVRCIAIHHAAELGLIPREQARRTEDDDARLETTHAV